MYYRSRLWLILVSSDVCKAKLARQVRQDRDPGAFVQGLITSDGITLNNRHKKERKSKRIVV
jgi:hypothetical protein